MKKTKVMIVDDEIEFAQPLSERLALRNFETQTAICAEDAMALLRTNWQPDVVVLDLRMPGLDGLDSLSLFKQVDPAMEVIIVSGHGSTAVGIEGMRRGLFDYLLKPVEIDDLVQRIKAAAEKRGLALNQLKG
jgi:DNA-binding NtrC family response regulator